MQLKANQLNLLRDARNEVGTAAMALAVGVIAGLGAVVFRKLIALFHNLFFFGRLNTGYDALQHTVASPWGAAIILAPVAGALIVTFLVDRFAPEAKGHGVPEVIDAVYFKRGVIRAPVALIKALASSISIGSGGAVGREGPIVQIGATFGSRLALWARIPEWQRLVLIACGGGAGIAATFNTPLGGVLFAVELLLVEISARTLIPVLIATGTASLIGRVFFGDHPSFVVPPLMLRHPALGPGPALVAYVVMGLLTGIAAMIYVRAIYGFEDLFKRVPGNDYTRHVLGMLLVGVMMFVMLRCTGHYYVEGVGYAAVQDALDGSLTAGGFALLLAALKVLATSLTLGSGASGGVFSPALFIGATLGAGLAALAHVLLPNAGINPATAAVIGMACMVGASTGAAVTAIVMIFEMTRDYHVIIPLIISVSVAYSMRRLLLADTVYTMKLTRRGQHIPNAIQSQLYLTRRALEFVNAPFLCLGHDATLGEALARRRRLRRTPRVVLMDDGVMTGVVPARILRVAGRELTAATPLRELADRHVVVIESSIKVFDLISLMRHHRCRNAVMTRDGVLAGPQSVLGVVTWEDLVENANLSASLDFGKEVSVQTDTAQDTDATRNAASDDRQSSADDAAGHETYWLQRWRDGRIGWHHDGPMPLLTEHWPKLDVPPGTRVLVPLCGKSVDMLWLSRQGMQVLGVEVSPIAVEAFLADNDLHARTTSTANGTHHEITNPPGGAIQVVNGNIFGMASETIAACKAVYDRAALIALPARTRERLAHEVYAMLPAGSRMLMITLDYPQAQMAGPPFSIDDDEIHRLFDADWQIDLLERRDILDSQPSFQEQGVTSLHTSVYAMTRRAHG
jgi:chloride channel protein, CIC family